MPVYADVLFVINAFVNYLLLLITMKLSAFRAGRLRLLAGSFIAGLFSLKIFIPPLPFSVELLIRLLVPTIILSTVFSFKSFSSFAKSYITYLIISFTFSGVIIAVIYFIDPKNLLYINGIIYYDLSFIETALLSVLAFTVISLAEKLLSRKSDKAKIYQITVFYKNKSVKGRALADTGNCLKDAFSKNPVIVCDYNAIKQLAPEGISEYLSKGSISIYNEPLRIIPVSTVSGTGLLPAFKSETVLIKSINKEIKRNDVYIAVSKESICHGEFEFLLNNSILEDMDNEKSEAFNKEVFKAT